MTKEQLKFWSLVGVRSGVAACALGWLMNILHWTGGNLIFTLGSALVILSYGFRTYHKEKRTILDWVKLCMVLSIFIRAIVHTNHLPFPNYLWIGLGFITLASIVYVFFSDSSSLIPSAGGHLLSKIFYSLAGSSIVIGAMFKIMHWPGAAELLILGNSCLCLWLVMGPFLTKGNSKHYESENIFSALDESLTVDKETTENHPKKIVFRPVFFLSAVLMILGLVLSMMDITGSAYVVLAGFISGSIYLFLTLKS